MGPAQAIKTGFAKSFKFNGGASRPEFWWFAFAMLLIHLGIAVLFLLSLNNSFIALLFVFLCLSVAQISFWSAGMRRFIDAGFTRFFPLAFGIISLCIQVWVLIIIFESLYLGLSIHSEAVMGIGIIGLFIYPAILLFAFLINSPFWLLPSAHNPNEVSA